MIVEKLLLGVSLSAPFGPLSAEAIKRGIRGGFFPAFYVRLGGAIGNLTCLLIVYFSLSYLMNHADIGQYAGAIGSVLLTYLGIRTVRQSLRINFADMPHFEPSNGVWLGFLLAIFNPFGIVWWLSVFSTSMTKNGTNWGSLEGLLQNLLIIVGVLAWIVVFSLILEFAKRFMNPLMVKVMTVLAGLSLIGFGIYYAIVFIF